MKKLFKIFFFLTILIVAVIVAAVVAIPMYFDPNDHKDRIVSLAEEHTGRKMTLDGNIGLSVFPWLGLELGAVSVGNAPGFGDAPFAATEKVNIRVQMMPLLRKEVRMDTITIEGLKLNLARNKQGKSNWDDLVAKGGSKDKKDAGGSPPVELAALALGGVNIKNATMNWIDKQAGQSLSIKGMNLTTGELTPDKPIDIDLSMNIDSSAPAIKGQLALTGTVSADVGNERYAVNNLKLSATLSGNEIPGGKAEVELAANIEADMKKQTVILNDLSLQTAGTDISGKLKASGIQGKTPGVNGQLVIKAGNTSTLFALIGQPELADTLKSFNVDVGISGDQGKLSLAPFSLDASVGNEKLAGGVAKVNMSSRADIDLAKETLTMTGLTISGLGLDVKGSLAAGGIKSKPRFKGKLAVSPFDLRNLLVQVGQEVPVTADPKALTRVGFITDFAGSVNNIKLTALTAVLDDSTLTGNLSVDNFKSPALGFALNLDAIDADRYLPPKKEGETAKAASPGAAAGAAAQLPLETLRAVNAKGNVTIGKLKISNLNMSQLKLIVNAKDGDIRLTPSAKLYKGSYQGAIGINAKGQQAVVNVNEKLTGVEAEPLLNDLTGEAKLRGTGNFSAKLTTSGATTDAMKAALNGNMSFSFRNGAIKGFNIGKTLRSITSLRENMSLSVSDEEETDFAEVVGNPVVRNGIVTLDDLSLKNPALRIQGKGIVADLPRETIDYRLSAILSETSKGQGGKDTSKLAGIEVPIMVTGSLKDPKIAPDLGGIAMKAVEKEIKNKLGDKLKGVLPGGLDGLLGGGGSSQTTAPASTTTAPAAPPSAPSTAPQSPAPPAPKKSPEDALKDALKSIF